LLIGFISDLHCEMCNELISIPEQVEVLVLAGDIHVKPKLLKDYLLRLRATTDIPIIYILGNHEYYGHVFPEIQQNYRNQVAKVPNAYLLEKDSIIIDGVRFLGTTLWSDLSDPMHAFNVQNGLNDFRKISKINYDCQSKIKYAKFRSDDYNCEFEACRDWLEEELKKEFKGPTVVVTHHSPSPITCSPYFKYSKIRYGFHSNISDFVIDYGPKLWIYGHDHVTARHELGQTLLVSNQPGYPHEHRHGAVIDIKEV